MNKLILGFLAIILISMGSCSKMDKTLNNEDLPAITEDIRNNKDYPTIKQDYIIDELTENIGYSILGEVLAENLGLDMKGSIPTFREEIEDLSISYDSLDALAINAREINIKLDSLITLIYAQGYSTSKYQGKLGMELKFNNLFDKEILYVGINYKYVTKYDTEFFNERTKVTNDIVDFRTTGGIITTESYNDAAEFLYTKVPVKEKPNHMFLMEGLKVHTLLVVFVDKSEVYYEKVTWEYSSDQPN